MADNKGVHVYRPRESESVRHIESTKEDRATYAKQFREEKKFQEEVKAERFAKIEERRKGRSGSGSSNGINIKVDGDN